MEKGLGLDAEFRIKDKNFQKKIRICFAVAIAVGVLLVVADGLNCDIFANNDARVFFVMFFALALAIPTVAGMLFIQKREGHWIRHGYYSVNKAEYPDGYISKNLGKKSW